MSQVIVQNKTRPLPRPIHAEYCHTFFAKFRGLMLKPEVGKHGGILLAEQRDSRMDTAIHMLFMRFDIAVVWINSDMTVVDVRHARKWQVLLAPARPARYVLETHLEHLDSFTVGDKVELVHG